MRRCWQQSCFSSSVLTVVFISLYLVLQSETCIVMKLSLPALQLPNLLFVYETGLVAF